MDNAGFCTFSCNPDVEEFKKDHFVICDIPSFLHDETNLTQISRRLLFIISPLSDDENIEFIEKYKIEHLVGQNEDFLGDEIMTYLNYLNDEKKRGLDPYLKKESKLISCSIKDSNQIDELIQEVISQFDFSDYFVAPESYLKVVANELITNSVYKGPNHRRKEKGLDVLDRSSRITIDSSDEVQFKLGMDEKRVCLSVVDLYGGLSYDLLISSLIRSFKDKTILEKKDGAGLGLYLIYKYSNQLIVNIVPNIQTEIICIIDKTNRYKNYKQRIRSFHFFQGVSGENT